MSKLTYSELWDKLLEKVPSPEIFNWNEYNLIKLFQHAYNASQRGKINRIKNHYLLQTWIFNLILIFKNKRNKNKILKQQQKLTHCSERNYILLAGGNVVAAADGHLVSANAQNLMKVLGREKCLYIYNPAKRAIVQTGQELDLDDITGIKSETPLNNEEIRILKSLKQHINGLKAKAAFSDSEINHYQTQVQFFFNSYRDWNYVLNSVKPEKLFFSPHYFNEGLILACKLNNVECVELQHGLISREDFYYVYPKTLSEIMPRALMADKILVFGEFWKREILLGCEYPEEKISVIGKYQYHPEISEDSLLAFRTKHKIKAEQKIVAVACQTNNPEYYAEYTEQLARMLAVNEDVIIVIKPHPRQLGMERLQKCCSFSNVRLMEKTENLMLLLRQSYIQISIYSTTFFDAIGCGVINMSLQDSGNSSDYARSMVELGIALPLFCYENPFDVLGRSQKQTNLRESDVYATFNEDFHKL